MISYSTNAQLTKRTQETYIHGSLAFGSGSLVSAGFYHSWLFGGQARVGRTFFIGTGLRFNGFGASNIKYTSAPPSLFGTNDADTLFAPEPSINSVNAFINFGYNFNTKVQMGFDLDLIGASWGPSGNPSFISGGDTSASSVTPTPFNIMLVGARDRGSLQGGPYFRYKFTDRFSARAKIHTVFTELRTTKILQTMPEENKRFRNSSMLFGIGASYMFNRY